MCKVVFSLLCSINQSACSALEKVVNSLSISEFDWVILHNSLIGNFQYIRRQLQCQYIYNIIPIVYTLAILWAGTWLNVLSRLALTPGGGSNTNTRPALSRFVGSFGFISIVKNNLNEGDGWRLEKTKKETNYLHLWRLISSFCWHFSPHFLGCKISINIVWWS